jgi:Mn-dependent DtxR family transcriptional regulator
MSDHMRISRSIARSELFILLHSYYPEWAPLSDLRKSLAARNPRSVSNQLSAMSSEKLVHHDGAGGYRLTQPGYAAAMEVIKSLLTDAAA